LRTLQPGVGEEFLTLLRLPHPLAIESMLTSLINDLAAAGAPCALVLDDYHVIAAQPIHDGLSFLIQYMPPAMHLILASRVEPPCLWPSCARAAR